MYILVALICVLNGSERGHECKSFVYPDQFTKVEDCRAFKFRQAMYVLPRQKSKMAMGDCVYRHTKTVIM